MKKRAIIFLTVLACVVVSVLALIIRPHYIQSKGEIKTINVKADKDFIDWGLMDRGENKSTPITVFNVGNVAFNLTLWHDAPTYILSGWDLEGYVLQPFENVTGSIWLEVDLNTPSNITSFAFNYVLIGIED